MLNEFFKNIVNFLTAVNIDGETNINNSLTVLSSLEVQPNNSHTTLYVENSLVGINTEFPNVSLTVNGKISSNKVIYDEVGNSTMWNSGFTSVSKASANWDSVYSSVKDTSGNWDSVYTSVLNTSANWDSVYSSVLNTSANWDSVYTSVKNTSGNWNSVYTSVNPVSSNWNSVYSTYNKNSATYATIEFSNNKFLPLSGGTITGDLIVDNTLQVGDGNPNFDFIITDEGNVGINTETPNEKLTVVGNISSTGSYYGDGSKLTGIVAGDTIATTLVRTNSGNWDSVYSSVLNTSGNWDSVYSTYNKNSADYTKYDYVNNSFLPLSGGTVTGITQFNNNVTIWGVLSATGGTYFANTIYSTTSAISVVHVGSGPALYVGSIGTGDIASFYDLDQNLEMLHIGGHNGDFPNVGVKTSTPNKDFTVNGEISASEIIYDKDGNSTQWNSVYSSYRSASASVSNYLPLSGGTLTGKLNLSSTAIKAGLNIGQSVSLATPYEIGDLWRNSSGRISYALSTNTASTVAELERANSYTQSQSITNNNNTSPALRITQTGLANALLIDDDTHPDSTPFVINNIGSVGIGLSSLSGIDAKLTVIGNVSATGSYFGDGSKLTGIVAGDTIATTLVRTNSANWDSVYTSVKDTSGNWNSVYSTTNTFSSNWQTTHSTVNILSGYWVKFQPAGEVYPESRASFNSDTYGSGTTYRQLPTRYGGSIVNFYYTNDRWEFVIDDGDTIYEIIQATTTGGTYPWNVSYNNDSGGNELTVFEFQEPVPRLVGTNLALNASEGTSIYASRADHVHPFPSAAQVGAAPLVNNIIPSVHMPPEVDDVEIYSSFIYFPNTELIVTTNISISGYSSSFITGDYKRFSLNNTSINNQFRIYRKYINFTGDLYSNFYFEIRYSNSRWNIFDGFGNLLVRSNNSSNNPYTATWPTGTTVTLKNNLVYDNIIYYSNRIFVDSFNKTSYYFDQGRYFEIDELDPYNIPNNKKSIKFLRTGSYGYEIFSNAGNRPNGKPFYQNDGDSTKYIEYEVDRWRYKEDIYDEDTSAFLYSNIYNAVVGNEEYPWLAKWQANGITGVSNYYNINSYIYNNAPKPLAEQPSSGTSIYAARADHVHPLPTEASNWNSVYTTVQAKSATEWDNTLANSYTHTNFLPLTGGIISANSSTNALTVVGNISATQDYFSGSNKSVFTPQTNTIGVSAVSNIVVVSVLPVTPDPSTLYIII